MRICPDWDLQPLNTLAVPARADYFCAAHTEAEILAALDWARQRQLPVQLLGGGSNLVMAERLPGLTLQIRLQGISLAADMGEQVLLDVAAGESWHQLVVWCLERGFYGLENLALIPGTVGAAPVQNIGAYGVEISRFVESVATLDRRDGASRTLSAADCEFSYRDSVFKRSLRDQRVITRITLRLQRHPQPEISYPALREALDLGMNEETEAVTPQAVFDAVCRIRREKLPDPALIPNCGSFFKNPILPWTLYATLQRQYPDMPSYDASLPGNPAPVRKVAAAWLIDRAGWKGREYQGVRVHERQALVLTNAGHRGAGDILALAREIRQSVQARFGVELELEPELLGF